MEITLKISHFCTFQTSVTLDRVIWHIVVYQSSTSNYIPNFVQIGKTFCGRTLRPALLGRLGGVDLITGMVSFTTASSNFTGFSSVIPVAHLQQKWHWTPKCFKIIAASHYNQQKFSINSVVNNSKQTIYNRINQCPVPCTSCWRMVWNGGNNPSSNVAIAAGFTLHVVLMTMQIDSNTKWLKCGLLGFLNNETAPVSLKNLRTSVKITHYFVVVS